MKNVIKMLGIIALVAVIGLGLAACDEPTTPDTATLRYETVPYSKGFAGSGSDNYNLAYSARDNTNNYYLFVLGHINFVPLAYRDAIIYNGKTPITIGYSNSDVSETSISKSVEEAYSYSFSESSTTEWSKSKEVGACIDGWFSAKVSKTKGGSTGWDKTNTNSVANTFTTASSKARELTDSIEVTIGNNNEPSGKYRFSLFSTTDVYYVLVTNRAKTQVTQAYTAVCARPQSLAWGIDYEPDMGGSFAKTAGGDLLTIPQIVLSRLPDPADIYDGSTFLPNEGSIQEFDIFGRTSFTIGISANIDRAVITGDSNTIYRDSEIIVAQRTSPLTIELNNVYAVGINGGNGVTGQDGGYGRPVISMGSNMAGVPDLTIVSSGSSNELQGGAGGHGGRGNDNSTGAHGGYGGAAIMADKITITGNANIVLIGGNGGNGGLGGKLGTSTKGTSGGNGGNGGASINANNITVNISGIVFALRSSGGSGGSKHQGDLSFLVSGGSNGANGAQGVQFTSTPDFQNGVILDRR